MTIWTELDIGCTVLRMKHSVDRLAAARVASAIKSRAKAAGVPITSLAALCEISQTAFYDRLTGVTDWRLRELSVVANRLGVPVEDIIIDAPFRPSELAANASSRDTLDQQIPGLPWNAGAAGQTPDFVAA